MLRKRGESNDHSLATGPVRRLRACPNATQAGRDRGRKTSSGGKTAPVLPLADNCTIRGVSPEDLRHLRRRFRLTQVQFADRLGVSPALVASLECGRRRITERQVREIDRIFGNVYKQQPRFLANTVVSLVQKTSSSQRSGGTADKPATASGQR